MRTREPLRRLLVLALPALCLGYSLLPTAPASMRSRLPTMSEVPPQWRRPSFKVRGVPDEADECLLLPKEDFEGELPASFVAGECMLHNAFRNKLMHDLRL